MDHKGSKCIYLPAAPAVSIRPHFHLADDTAVSAVGRTRMGVGEERLLVMLQEPWLRCSGAGLKRQQRRMELRPLN